MMKKFHITWDEKSISQFGCDVIAKNKTEAKKMVLDMLVYGERQTDTPPVFIGIVRNSLIAKEID